MLENKFEGTHTFLNRIIEQLFLSLATIQTIPAPKNVFSSKKFKKKSSDIGHLKLDSGPCTRKEEFCLSRVANCNTY